MYDDVTAITGGVVSVTTVCRALTNELLSFIPLFVYVPLITLTFTLYVPCPEKVYTLLVCAAVQVVPLSLLN